MKSMTEITTFMFFFLKIALQSSFGSMILTLEINIANSTGQCVFLTPPPPSPHPSQNSFKWVNPRPPLATQFSVTPPPPPPKFFRPPPLPQVIITDWSPGCHVIRTNLGRWKSPETSWLNYNIMDKTWRNVYQCISTFAPSFTSFTAR